MAYKGMMLSGVPNLALALGYTNASWTLKCDLDLRVRLPPAQPHGRARLPPVRRRRTDDPSVTELPFIDFSSGYVLRSIDKFPKQGSKAPVAAAPELRARHLCAEVRLAGGRGDGVLAGRGRGDRSPEPRDDRRSAHDSAEAVAPGFGIRLRRLLGPRRRAHCSSLGGPGSPGRRSNCNHCTSCHDPAFQPMRR